MAILLLSGSLFGVLAACVFPGFSRFQESIAAMGADAFHHLPVFGVFVAGMMKKGLNDLATVIFLAIGAGDMTFSQAAFLHFARLKSRKPLRYPGLQPLQVFSNSR